MQIKLIIPVFLFCCIFCSVICIAQPSIQFQNYSISKLTPDDGLSQGSNYFRFEDSKGFMWITCNDALNRYDGKMVKVYNLNKYFKDCPNLQQGYGFAEDPEGNVYVGSTRGLYVYRRNHDNFTLKKIFTGAPDEVAMPFAYRDGKIWCFNRQYEIAVYDVVTTKVTYVSKVDIMPIKSVHIYQIGSNAFYYRFPFMDKEGSAWFVADNNIVAYDIHSKTFSYPLQEYAGNNKFTFYSTAYDAVNNRILLGTQNGIVEYAVDKKKLKHVKDIQGKALGIVNYICVGKKITAFSADQGLAVANGSFDKIFFPYPYDRRNKNNICQFSFDKSDRLWVCDDGLGQVIFNFNAKLIDKEPGENVMINYSGNRSIISFAELPGGDMLVNTNIRHRIKDRLIDKFSISFLPDESYRAYTDRCRKGIWLFPVGLNIDRHLIFFLDEKMQLNNFSSQISGANPGQQQDLQVLPDARVICSFDKGLYWLNTESKNLVKITSLPQLNPFKINILGKNRIAVSYLNNDMLLAGVLPDNRVILEQKILPGVQSFYIQEDTVNKKYWVGTNKGIYLLDNRFNTIKLFDANNGLAGTYIYGLLLDDKGNAWCSHQRGLSSIDAKTFQIINYDKSDGIQDWDFNNRSFYKATDGTMYFGGVTGFNYFKPPLKPFSAYSPEVYVDEILVNNRPWLPDTNANNLQKLTLSFSENNLFIKAIIKDLGNANARQLIYRLQETDSKWKYLPNNTAIIFNSLAPGTYTLELGTYDKFADTEIKQKTIVISIAYPFYLKSWFWALAAFILAGLIFGIYNQRRSARQKIAFQQQLALEKQRNKITADLHDDIGASLSSLQVNSAVASQLLNKNAGQAQQVLEKIESQSKNLAEKIGDIIWSMKPGKDEFMTMSSRIKNFTNDILGATEIHYEVLIDKEVDTAITDITARKNMVLITKEAINNAVKYSKASHMKVEIKLMEHAVELTIADDGTGFITGEISGNGIANMKRRAAELNGTFLITSAPNMGTVITVSIPIVP